MHNHQECSVPNLAWNSNALIYSLLKFVHRVWTSVSRLYPKVSYASLYSKPHKHVVLLVFFLLWWKTCIQQKQSDFCFSRVWFHAFGNNMPFPCALLHREGLTL